MKQKVFGKSLFFIALGIIVLIFTYSVIQARIYFDDGLDYAQIARALISGRGFSLSWSYLPGLEILQKHNLLDGNWPNLQKSPFPALLLAIVFSVTGVSEKTIMIPSILAYLLLIGVFIYFSSTIVRFDWRATSISTILMLFQATILDSVFFGQPEVLTATFFLLFLAMLIKRHFILAGIIAGLAYLTRQESLVWIVVGILWYFYFYKNERRRLIQCIIAFMVISLPWMIYMFRLTGNPLFTLQGTIGIPALTKTYPYYLYTELRYVDPVQFILFHPGEIIMKGIKNSVSFFRDLPFLFGMPLCFVFLVYFFFRKDKELLQSLKIYIFLISLFLSFAVFLFIPETRYFIVLFPTFILFGTHVFLETVVYLKRKKIVYYIFIVIFFLTNLYGYSQFIIRYQARQSYMYEKSELLILKREMGQRAIVATTLPRVVGFFGDNKAIALPKNTKDLGFVEKEYIHVDFIYLPSARLYDMLPIWKPYWGAVLTKKPKKVGDFILIRVFPSGSLLYKKI